jgi:hypothetical protein
MSIFGEHFPKYEYISDSEDSNEQLNLYDKDFICIEAVSVSGSRSRSESERGIEDDPNLVSNEYEYEHEELSTDNCYSIPRIEAEENPYLIDQIQSERESDPNFFGLEDVIEEESNFNFTLPNLPPNNPFSIYFSTEEQIRFSRDIIISFDCFVFLYFKKKIFI